MGCQRDLSHILDEKKKVELTGKAIIAKTKLFINKYRLYVPGEALSLFSASANFPFFLRVTSPRASMACSW